MIIFMSEDSLVCPFFVDNTATRRPVARRDVGLTFGRLFLSLHAPRRSQKITSHPALEPPKCHGHVPHPPDVIFHLRVVFPQHLEAHSSDAVHRQPSVPGRQSLTLEGQN